MNIKFIDGGVTAPKGFKASGICCGIKPGNTAKKDLAFIYAEKPCTAAAVYTKNLVKGAPVLVTKKNLENGIAQAVIVNSGNANTCNADGIEKAQRMCEIASVQLDVKAEDVIVASTGVIGQVLPIEPIEKFAPKLKELLSSKGSADAAEAIMTTDTIKKEVAAEIEIDGKTVTIGAIAKGSGMIHINMATMLSFVTTDAVISHAMLKKAIKEAADETFNMVSVDGDTSTNDTLAIMASGFADNKEIVSEGESYTAFVQGLTAVCEKIARLLAGDGEGASKLLVCDVKGAKSKKDAKMIARSIICSNLVKAAMFGADANCGRILCAAGYSGAELDVKKIDVSYKSAKGEILVCQDGLGLAFDEDKAKKILLEKEIEILVNLGDGSSSATAYGCDLTYDYVKINGDYRT